MVIRIYNDDLTKVYILHSIDGLDKFKDNFSNDVYNTIKKDIGNALSQIKKYVTNNADIVFCSDCLIEYFLYRFESVIFRNVKMLVQRTSGKMEYINSNRALDTFISSKELI